MQRKEVFRGVTALLPTPFDRDGGVDLFAFENLIARQAATGGSAAILGRIGESSVLREEERLMLTGEACAVCARRARLLVCIDASEGERALEMAREAEILGADGFIVYPGKTDARGLYAFVKRLSAVGLPICILRHPGGQNLAFYAEFAAIEEVEAIGELTGCPLETLTLERLFGERGRSKTGYPRIICAKEESLFYAPLLDYEGVFSPTAALSRCAMGELWRMAREKQGQEALWKMRPQFDRYSGESGAARLKKDLACEGLCLPTVRLPLVEE